MFPGLILKCSCNIYIGDYRIILTIFFLTLYYRALFILVWYSKLRIEVPVFTKWT